MGVSTGSAGSFADRIAAQLSTWPDTRVGPADCGVGTGVAIEGRQILHLHTPDSAELRLTLPVLQRMSQVLTASGRVAATPGDDWVRVHLESDSDMALVLSLVSVAAQAHDGRPRADALPCRLIFQGRTAAEHRP